MSYSIIGTGSVGSTLASFFAKAGIEIGLANTKGAEAVEPLAGKLGRSVVAKSLDDALKEVGDAGAILGLRSRVGLWRAQTPQAFRRDCIEVSVKQAVADGVACDDCSEMVTRAGYRVRAVVGSVRNMKITRPGDIELCQALLAVTGPPVPGQTC